MNGEEKLVKLKNKDLKGILMIPSRVCRNMADLKTGECYTVKSLNNILTEDKRTVMLGDDEFDILEEE